MPMKKRKPKRNTWQDHYSRRAQKENYAARSVYKLQELQKKFSLIRKGDRILDLGCAPGSWIKYAAELTGSRGAVVGIDIKPVTVKLPVHVSVYRGDVLALDAALRDKLGEPFDAIISDMAPNTTGNRDVDAARSFHLCEAALNLCHDMLALQGAFVCKIFQGELFQEFSNSVKTEFKRQHLFKPKSSRKASKEIFVVGIGKLDFNILK